jgi:LysM repeat protein
VTAALDSLDVSTLTVIRDSLGDADPGIAPSTGPKMTLVTESGSVVLAVDVAPQDIEYSKLENEWTEAERSGTTPLLLHSGVPLYEMQFSFMITDKLDMYAPQTAKIDTLRKLARHGEKILCRYGPSEQGTWRVKSASLSSELRNPSTQEISRATVSITLTQSSDAAPAVGPVLRPPPPPPPPPAPPPPRTYVVVKGDCLWRIAQRFYGPNAGPQWPRIYDANRNQIRDPHWIYPGQRFVIP